MLHDGMVEHASMMLDDSLVAAIRKADPQAQPALTYLANTIRLNGREIPYSVVTAMDLPELASDDEIVLNEWAARDLEAKPGDTVTLEYYLWDPSGKLVTKIASFRNAGAVPIEDWQRHLSPDYPGISDAPTISDWDPPFPMDLGRIRKADEEYWNQYRATPKAFITLNAGQKLWRSRYGAVTGMRSNAHPSSCERAIDPLSIAKCSKCSAKLVFKHRVARRTSANTFFTSVSSWSCPRCCSRACSFASALNNAWQR